MGFAYSVDDHSPHNFGLAFNSRPLRRARSFLVLSRLKACDQAWQSLQEDAVSLAILDWMMPGIDGAEVCRRLRAIKTQNPTYVIMLTAKTDKKDVGCSSRSCLVILAARLQERTARVEVCLKRQTAEHCFLMKSRKPVPRFR